MLSEFDLFVRLLLAAGLGALIGFEREIDDEPAGLRTHMLICIGATLFTIVSTQFVGASDTSRIAAGVVTGIGFLGAGTIFRSENRVRGLTTAADLWVLAAAGIAIGIGYYLAAVSAAVIVFAILYLKKIFGRKD
ncbi:MAG: MgtC/SapB family protein [Candidatus Diapherotrites archaeon]|uniref:MgtC/SapB family protein n=1 Tax=Candidatus Iainarchaeum sp. TaxID=3101447 RepID=A0A7J4ITB0_9ARCH|nr:MAG: hypothetical protein QT03_C0001G0496 [archaeon GW2011_AR10]MBS3059055.1 MgtC/SapB family protein [Candidatus Diapherotrites archaeon]HIH08751.1 MgtC/SapB family protein [Candidatus Diapherotrites archaeon]